MEANTERVTKKKLELNAMQTKKKSNGRVKK